MIVDSIMSRSNIDHSNVKAESGMKYVLYLNNIMAEIMKIFNPSLINNKFKLILTSMWGVIKGIVKTNFDLKRQKYGQNGECRVLVDEKDSFDNKIKTLKRRTYSMLEMDNTLKKELDESISIASNAYAKHVMNPRIKQSTGQINDLFDDRSNSDDDIQFVSPNSSKSIVMKWTPLIIGIILVNALIVVVVLRRHISKQSKQTIYKESNPYLVYKTKSKNWSKKSKHSKKTIKNYK